MDEEDDDGIRYRSDDDWDWDLDEIYGLDDESISLFIEIKERIEKLQQKGVDSIIIEHLFPDFVNATPKFQNWLKSSSKSGRIALWLSVRNMVLV